MSKQKYFFGLILTAVFLAAWLIQDRLFLNWDVSYLLRAAKLLAAGGCYARDFFTPNPPLILYLYLPPLMLSQVLALSLIISVRLYLFFLIALSLAVCGAFTARLFPAEDETTQFIKRAFVLALALVLLVLPVYDFGQREHLLLILTFPYVLLVTGRLQGLAFKARTALAVGLMAGLGLALKPQFYLLPLFIEIFYLLKQRKVLAWLRPETLVILSILILYALTLVFLYPDFVWLVLPYVLRNFYGSIGEPWSRLFFNHVVLFCCLPLVLFGVLYRKNPYKNLCMMLVLAELAFLCVYLAQQTTFYYHLLPAYSTAILLQVLLFGVFAAQSQYSWRDYGAAILTGLLGFAFLYYQTRPISLVLLFATTTFFCFFGTLFVFLLLALPQKIGARRILISLALILGVGFLCFYLAQNTSWASHQTLITVLVLLALFGLLAPRARRGVGANMLVAALGMLIFAHPAFFSYCLYWKGQQYRETVLDKLIVFLRGHAPHRSIYVFSMRGSYGSPLVDYADSHLAQRFDCMWPAEGFTRRSGQGSNLQKDKSLFIEMIAEDLHLGKPDLVFVDKRDAHLLMWDPQFNYLTFFSQNPRFRQEWKDYRYLTTLKEVAYELDVYQRRGI